MKPNKPQWVKKIAVSSITYTTTIFFVCILNSKVGLCSELSDAKQEQDRAYKNYYLELKKMDHRPNPQELSQIQQKTIVPAMVKFENIINHEFVKTETKIREHIAVISIKSGLDRIAAALITNPFSKSKNSTTPTGPSNPSNLTPPSPTPEPAPVKKPILSIDRGQFSKEITFGKSKTTQIEVSASPSPMPTAQLDDGTNTKLLDFKNQAPAPTPKVMLPPSNGNTGVMEFGPAQK